MKKFKLDRNISTRISALAMAGIISVTALGFSGCKQQNNKENASIVAIQNTKDSTQKGIKYLFPTMNEEIVNNSSLIILLDEIAKKDENGKIDAEVISNFKSKIDTENMMSDFNSFLDVLEQSMIESKKVITVSNLVIDKDEEILANIEEITSKIISGTKEEIKTNFDLIYTLFVEEDEITYNGLTFDIRDLSYAGREIASTYARTSAYFAKSYISKQKYEKIDSRTNNQNSKAYIKTQLEILSNDMEEKSVEDVETIFNVELEETKKALAGKINISDANIKKMLSYINIEYLNSDKVSNKDKSFILGTYEEENVKNSLLIIDAITEHNKNNKDNLILLSDMLIDKYKETETGKVDIVALDYIQFNSIMLLNTTTEESKAEEIFNNPYFQNIYKYLRKANFVHKYTKDKEVNINYQDISDGAKFVLNEIVNYTLNQRSNVYKYTGYKSKVESNLKESIQYIQNIITGECELVELNEFIKTK